MHRRSVSSSATEGNTERVLLQKRGSLHAGAVGYGAGRPSRFRAEADAQFYANGDACAASCARARNSLSEDQIICQSKLYDAFELQELEQHLDRKFNFVNDCQTGSISRLISDQQSVTPHKSFLSASNLLNDRPPFTDDPRGHACCTCNLCKSPSLSCLIDDSRLPATSKESLTTVSNILMEPDGSNQPRGGADEENHASLARRSFSMPRSQYIGAPAAGSANLDVEREALQDLQVHADPAANVVKAHKQSRAKSSRWSLVNSLFRSLGAGMGHKKQDNTLSMEKGSTSNLTSTNFSRKQRPKEYHHHHNIVHYHHVHHHHHHHVVNGVYFEEIDWPLSPARLQELGWLMSKS